MEIPWRFFRKGALVLFAVALFTGMATTALFMGHRMALEAWRVLFVLALVVLTVTSAILLPGVLLPNIPSPHPEFLSADLVDEWQDMRARRVTRPHLLIAGAVLAALIYLWFLFYYGKIVNAVWFGWLPVAVAAIFVSLLVIAFARRTPWYHDRYFRTPNTVIAVAFGGFALAQVLGITMTEQVVTPAPGQGIVSNLDYQYVGTRAYRFTRGYLEFGPVPDIEVPDCDDDSCGYLFLFILFVVLTAILVAGAALVPHMWVLSCLVMLTFIALLVLHEVRRDRTIAEYPVQLFDLRRR
jgi:hypothetical protein